MMNISKRKIRSDKLPLTLHPTGQYCKKINGKIRYFGKDKKKALEKYLAQATYLHGAQSLGQKISNGKMTLKQLCDLYLRYQNSRVFVGDITAKHYNDSKCSLGRFMAFLGPSFGIENISTLDLTAPLKHALKLEIICIAKVVKTQKKPNQSFLPVAIF